MRYHQFTFRVVAACLLAAVLDVLVLEPHANDALRFAVLFAGGVSAGRWAQKAQARYEARRRAGMRG